ncbi:hypothetical protein MLD38_038163 [Melastoma candidum]|uniref:Uncharacterized protein n=1 Tax=Melastoma candidum TaxID=119954 RepID=A0ACB9KZ20_9MYRT|nr:hypothetical protein MLD38_038163 [Melastoma candidum]
MEDRFLGSPVLTRFGHGRGVLWTKDENKMFESALALFDEDTPDRWTNVASLIPRKSPLDVEYKYRELLEDVSEIEAGHVTVPRYRRDFYGCRKRPYGVRDAGDHERKKGVPWTEEEHRRFLMGLVKYGKGDWRNISRNFVISKTPTQVASHAQKYFNRQLSEGKDKRRPSIHDITTKSITDPLPDNSSAGPVGYSQDFLTTGQKLALAHGLGISSRRVPRSDAALIVFESDRGNLFATDTFGSPTPGGRSTRHHLM